MVMWQCRPLYHTQFIEFELSRSLMTCGKSLLVYLIHVFGFVKELNDVGKDLPTRAGDSEANREKNRYPYILPCKCTTASFTEECLAMIYSPARLLLLLLLLNRLVTDDHCRVRLSIQNSQSHSDYINASFVPVRTPSLA